MAKDVKITDKNTLLLIALADLLGVDVPVEGFGGIWDAASELKAKLDSNYCRGVYRGKNMYESIWMAESITELIELIDMVNAEDIEHALRNKILGWEITGLPKSRDLKDWQKWLIEHNTAGKDTKDG